MSERRHCPGCRGGRIEIDNDHYRRTCPGIELAASAGLAAGLLRQIDELFGRICACDAQDGHICEYHRRLSRDVRALMTAPPAYIPTEEDAALLQRVSGRMPGHEDGDALRALAARMRGK